jgi:hypothetical protein
MQGRVADYILAVDIHTAASQRRDAARVSLLGRCMHGAARARVSICTFVPLKQLVSQRRDAVRVSRPAAVSMGLQMLRNHTRRKTRTNEREERERERERER